MHGLGIAGVEKPLQFAFSTRNASGPDNRRHHPVAAMRIPASEFVRGWDVKNYNKTGLCI
jgi:hypothetical protein